MKWLRLVFAVLGIYPAILATGMGLYSVMFLGAAVVYWWFVVDTVRLFLKKKVSK